MTFLLTPFGYLDATSTCAAVPVAAVASEAERVLPIEGFRCCCLPFNNLIRNGHDIRIDYQIKKSHL